MQNKLKELIETFIPCGENDESRRSLDEKFWYHKDNMPFIDFTKEIYKPGLHSKAPNGAVSIYVDGNFWSAAVLPYEFHEMTAKEIVEILWPEVEEPEFGEDTYFVPEKN